METFETLVGTKLLSKEELMPLTQFQREFRAAMEEAGYKTREDIINLVREVRKEIADERAMLLQE